MPIINPICHAMWSLTPYDKCDFRCVYCCTKVQGTSRPTVPLESFTETFQYELDAIPQDDLLIVGAFCDAYPLAEEKLGLTRMILEKLLWQERKFDLVTKSTTILRDLDLLRDWRHDRKIYVSISSTDDAALARLDPGAPRAAARFEVVHAVRNAGYNAAVNVLPWIPDVTDTDEIIARTPNDVYMVFAPLQFGNDRDSMTLMGRRYTRDEVVERYMAEYERYGHHPNTSWVRPSPPPLENDPLYRMPVIDRSAAARWRGMLGTARQSWRAARQWASGIAR